LIHFYKRYDTVMAEAGASDIDGRNGHCDNIEEDLEDKREDTHTPPPLSPGIETVEQVCDILDKVENYSPVLPDAVTENILREAGFNNQDPQITRLVSLVAQKFMSDVAYEALQHCKMRGGGKEMKKVSGRDRKFALTSEDLLVALGDQGIAVKKPPFYAN